MQNMRLPVGWKVDKLENLVSFTRGSEPGSDSYTDDDAYTRFLRVSDISGTSKEKVYTAANNLKLVDKGDLLITLDGTPGIVSDQFEGAISSGIRKIYIINDELLQDYLKFYLRSDNVQRIIYKYATGATILHASKSIQYIEVIIPPLETQKKIVEILEGAEKALEKKKEAIRLVDELVKSRFIEMFGDPMLNPMRWNKEELINVCDTIVDCPHSTPKYISENTGFMCIRTTIIKPNCIDWEKIEYISQVDYENRIKRYKPKRGDIIYSREGAILGIAALIDKECNVSLGQRLMLLSANRNILNERYLCYAMNADGIARQVRDKIGGSASPHINVADVKNFKILVPPLDKQIEFASFMKQVDKLKFEMEESLKELENNFNSLMQSAFNGELFK
ncbi:MAG: restriction endonuclease subunit S [Clostridiaceae bacterium]|nr:restriction endonuclease subunit S [Clostridiaceae bacterium]